jgi:ABC-type nitrate/sulfonate/bicarbonate transport system substrate-binding protein
VAVDRGFFKQNHLDVRVSELPAGSLGAPALLNGDIDVADVGFNDLANLKAQGKDLIAIYDVLNRVTMDLVVSNKIVKERNLSPSMPLAERQKALKGLKIGITAPGAPTDIFSRYYLKQAGLDPDKDAQIIRIGSAGGLLAALKSGQIDAYMLSAPSPQQVEQQGFGKVIIKSSAGDVPELASFYYVVLAMRSDYVKQHPAVTKAYVKSIQQANDWMRAHHDDTVKTLQKTFPSVNPDTLALGYDSLLGGISKDGRFNEKIVKSTLELYKQYGVIQVMPSTKEGELWSDRYH